MQKSDAKDAEARASSAASAASTAAADGQSIKKDHAAASVGTVASKVQEAKGKDDKILSLIQERKSTAKNESEKIREISKEIKKCIRDNKRSKRQEKSKRSWKKSKVQGTFPVLKISEEAIRHPRSQKQRRRSRNDDTVNRKCICKILWRFVWRWRSLHWRRYGLAHWRWQNRS